MGLAAEQASARNQGLEPRPKTCPAAITRTPHTPQTPRTPRTPRSMPQTPGRTPLPNFVDPITKEVKYGDPNHRPCVPTYRPASAYLPRDTYSKYNDQTHTAARTIRYTSGMIWAIPHHVTPTGYKAPGAYIKFDDLTTKNFFENKVQKVGEVVDSLTKKLCPYAPTALRNLRKELSQTPVGLHSRDCRNASYLKYSTLSLSLQFEHEYLTYAKSNVQEKLKEEVK